MQFILEDILTEAITEAKRLYNQFKVVVNEPLKYRCDALIMSLAIHEKIKIESHRFSGDFCGVLLIDELETTIVYNLNQQPERRNFTLGHELGHYFLHRHKESQFVDRAANMLNNQIKPFEIQANAFAAYLLVPSDILSAMLNYRFSFYKIAKTSKISYEFLHWRLINHLTEHYCLSSADAMLLVQEYRELSGIRVKQHDQSLLFSLTQYNQKTIIDRLKRGDVNVKTEKDYWGNVVGFK